MTDAHSVFHAGEKAIQRKLGVEEKMAKFGKMVVRDHMPQQHRDFYQQLPFIFVGHADEAQQVWASMLIGDEGFISSPNDRQLHISGEVLRGDPLRNTLNSSKQHNRMGLLGIELSSRRRNRMSAKLSRRTEQSIELEVLQTFGNCPQYIQTRKLRKVESLSSFKSLEITSFNQETADFISKSDSFFVASSNVTDNRHTLSDSDGADVSHRGGMPGFVEVSDEITLTIPDYMGNNHFNTFGNIVENPKVGLLFVDFENGHLLTLTGVANILWDDERTALFKGAQRLWQFKLNKGFWLRNVLSYRWELEQFSPNTMMTGTWSQAYKSLEQSNSEPAIDDWCEYEVVNIEPESKSITSFHLIPKSGVLPSFTAGQFLTFKQEFEGKTHSRTYSLSSSPHTSHFRISVKREDGGTFSNFLHTQIKQGDTLLAKSPRGAFQLHTASDKPVVLLSAGVGITPMVSMFHFLVDEGVRTRKRRSVTMVNTSRNLAEQAFVQEIVEKSKESQYSAKAYWLLTQPESDAILGTDYSGAGRISQALLHNLLPLDIAPIDDHEFYLCGPSGFMQHSYDMLLEMGVADGNITTESFGPSSIKRANLPPSKGKMKTAKNALIKYRDSQVEQAWTESDGNLLSFAETHGIEPNFSCRSGQCGACKVKLSRGTVVHSENIGIPLKDDEVLLCSAYPRKTNEEIPVIEINV